MGVPRCSSQPADLQSRRLARRRRRPLATTFNGAAPSHLNFGFRRPGSPHVAGAVPALDGPHAVRQRVERRRGWRRLWRRPAAGFLRSLRTARSPACFDNGASPRFYRLGLADFASPTASSSWATAVSRLFVVRSPTVARAGLERHGHRRRSVRSSAATSTSRRSSSTSSRCSKLPDQLA